MKSGFVSGERAETQGDTELKKLKLEEYSQLSLLPKPLAETASYTKNTTTSHIHIP